MATSGDPAAFSRDSARRARRSSPENALQLKSVPAVGNPTDMDVVTSNVEQSTKSKVETAEKGRLFVKPPIIKP